jgi:hypothetical protein
VQRYIGGEQLMVKASESLEQKDYDQAVCTLEAARKHYQV